MKINPKFPPILAAVLVAGFILTVSLSKPAAVVEPITTAKATKPTSSHSANTPAPAVAPGAINTKPAPVITPTPVEITPPNKPPYIERYPSSDVVFAVNIQRESNNLPDLQENGLLDLSAKMKANDMCTNNYWSHDSPDGSTPWTFITGVGYPYTVAGENLSKGYPSLNHTINAWMNSPEHYENIVATRYTEQGAAAIICPYYQGLRNQLIIVNHFGSQS
jgi:uncharacterized protein YkwD